MTRLPLEHIRIIDLTQAWAGSYALQILGDFGADIIKIESRSRPDPWRGGFGANRGLPAYPVDGPGERPYNRAYLANSVNRNKRAISLDLNTEEGRGLFMQLVRDADVVSENFTPRVMNNLGIGFEALQSVRPSIILLSMPAFGLSGPYSEYPGIGGTVEPMSGNSWLLGEPGQGPQVSGVMYPDAVAGLNGASAVLAALHHRDSTGEGVHVEVSQHEAMVAMLGEFFAAEPTHRGRIGNSDLEAFPNGIYRTNDDGDVWAAISVRNESQWTALRDAVAANWPTKWPETDPAVSAAIDSELQLWVSNLPLDEVEAKLRRAGVPVGQARSINEVLSCPQLAATSYWHQVVQPEGIGTQPMPGPIARLSETPGDVRRPPARHGEHSREVLTTILGMSDAAYNDLEARGITGEGPPPEAAN